MNTKTKVYIFRAINVLRPDNWFRKQKIENVKISRILIGQQSGFPLEQWINLSKEYSRISRPITESPYVTFLKEIKKNERKLTDNRYLEQSDYFKMGLKCVQTIGEFMGAKNKEELKEWMKDYYKLYKNRNSNEPLKFKKIRGHSKHSSPIKLNKIKFSNCYEIIDGHHRIAIEYLSGKEQVRALVVGKKYSVLQKMLLKINQINDIELYQPVDRLEVESWPTVRICKDRFDMMKTFLKNNKISKGSLIDLATSYGWFPIQFKTRGFDVMGLDRDPDAIKISRLITGLEKNETRTIKIEDFLYKNKKRYDVVLFLSILHHYAIGKEKGRVNEILRELDKITKRVLFLDMGQNHEAWNKKLLPEWDDKFIEEKIKKNTSFKKVIRLGKDKDNRGKYRQNYRRTLFACVK